MSENIEVIIKDYISDEELQAFEKTYNKAKKDGTLNQTIEFEYGWALIRSQYKDDVRKGVSIYEGICNTNTDHRDFLFFISIGYYKIDEYHKALKYVKKLLVIEPHNRQGIALEDLITSKLRNRGLTGMALVVGGAALVGGAIAAALSRK